jgi:hypothetical protein
MSRASRLRLLGLAVYGRAIVPTLRPVLERGAWRFVAGMQIDADGAPQAYALPGSNLIGLDHISNAGSPTRWWGLACDGFGKPYIQGPNDPAPGYAVSPTALRDSMRPIRDPRAYVDASTVPYVVTPPELVAKGIKLGDLATVKYGEKVAHAIVADVGPHGHYGEGSPALAQLLDIPDSPRIGGVAKGVTYIIYSESRNAPPWPRDPLEFQAAAARRYAAWMSAA